MKIKSVVLSEAAKDKSMWAFQSYFCGICGYKRTKDGCFISEAVLEDGKLIPNIKFTLCDYCLNEPESEKLWQIANKIFGSKIIDFKVIKQVEL